MQGGSGPRKPFLRLMETGLIRRDGMEKGGVAATQPENLAIVRISLMQESIK